MRPRFLFTVVLSFAIVPWTPGAAAERPGILPDSFLRDSASSEVREVIDRAVFLGGKGVTFRGDLVVYEYLLNHLDFTSQPARALALSDYIIERTGPEAYEATTPRGGRAHLRVVYTRSEKRVVLAQGKYGQAVAVLQYDAIDLGGERYIVSNLYGYVRADNPILTFLLTLLGGVVDRRVDEVLRSVAELSERAYLAPASLHRELLAHPELPLEHLFKFGEILRQVSRHAARASSGPPS